MIPYVILGVLLGLPLVLGLAFRVSTSHIFFSLMAGELLGRYFGHDVGNIVHGFIRNEAVIEYSEVALVLLPMVLTAVFLKGTISKGMVIFHTLPLLITGVVMAAFLLPELPHSTQETVRSVEAGQVLMDLNEVIVGGVVAIQLISLWLLNQPHEGGGHHKKKHHHIG